jgi:sulfotransferase family protein
MKPNFTESVRPRMLAGKNFNKIFCVGYNKTGTTTMEGVLKLYGFSMPNQQEQEMRLTRQTFACNYAEFKSFVARFDAFQDMPFSQGDVYIAADALFPGSKFILTERDPQAWFRSITQYHKKVFKLDSLDSLTEQDVKTKFNYLYPGYSYENKKRFLTSFEDGQPRTLWDLLYDEDYYISEYLARNNRIKKYFLDCPDKLLVLDVTEEGDTARICRFLNIPEEFATAIPHLNKT